MAFWTYVIYPKTDFSALDFTTSITTNATLNPIYITVEDDDAWFNQSGADTGTPQVITNSTDPSLIGLNIWSAVFGNADVIYNNTGGNIMEINEISIGGATNWVLANYNGANTTLSPSTTYSDTAIISNTSWAHSGILLPCFTAGTRIRTPGGGTRIELLQAGDTVMTADHGAQTILWIGQRRIDAATQRADPTMRPILIRKGAMGLGLPRRDLRVSRQQRMLVRSRITQRMFETDEALIPAIKLVGLPGIAIDDNLAPVTYLHILCRRHEVLFAEDCPAESLFLGARIHDAAESEAFHLFDDLPLDQVSPFPARIIVQGKRATRFATRHKANNRALLEPAPDRVTHA